MLSGSSTAPCSSHRLDRADESPLIVGVCSVNNVLDVLELEVAAAFQDSKAPCIVHPRRAGAVLRGCSGDSGGVPTKRAKLPKSMKVLRTGMSSLRGGHWPIWLDQSSRASKLRIGSRRLRAYAIGICWLDSFESSQRDTGETANLLQFTVGLCCCRFHSCAEISV